ncbi:sugar kinase [Actinoplanes sp. NBRC 103695]|uniref:sugar kinase n=1 Tax=Actinoplanes sp. NBRC 103695 TaxID=3032202 RepID=UPI0024A335FF|nr:sugar kinase [Actinoplanes sp. NBRC 103695]GLZ00984.1 ribokinase [Actinoplanes sp. NBRC 103695]
MHLLTIGETLGVGATRPGNPLRTAAELRLSTAGAEATVAIGVSRLGHRVSYVGCVGDDALGRRVLRDLAGERVEVQHLHTVAGRPTGFMLRDLRTADRTVVTYYRDGSAGSAVRPAHVDFAFDALPTVDLVHLTGITPALSSDAEQAVRRAIERAHRAGIEVSFDVNHRHGLARSATVPGVLRTILERSTVVFVGDDELAVLGLPADPEAAAAVLARGPGEVVVKRGRDGAFAALADGTTAATAAPDVTVADVIGAGDSFVAGYLAARAEGRPLAERLAQGTFCAARTVGTSGDWEGLPMRHEMTAAALTGVTR